MGRTACTEPQCLYKGALYLLVLSRYNSFNGTDMSRWSKSAFSTILKQSVNTVYLNVSKSLPLMQIQDKQNYTNKSY